MQQVWNDRPLHGGPDARYGDVPPRRPDREDGAAALPSPLPPLALPL